MRLARCGLLLRSRLSGNPTIAAVVANAWRIRGVVVDHGGVVNVRDIRGIDVVDRRVVVKTVAIPAAAFIAAAKVSKPVINAAIKTYFGAPVAVIKNKAITAPSPIRRRPQIAHSRGFHPGARHPIIITVIIIPGPVAGGPDIALSGTYRLLINRNFRGAEGNRNAETNLCERARCEPKE